MERKKVIMDLRGQGKIKGVKPCYVFLKQNIGKIYNGTQADFIMSIKGNVLYFQKLSFWFKVLKPAGDFELNLKQFKEYAVFEHMLSNVLCLYDKNNNFIEISYHKGIADTYITEDNIARIIKILEENGINQIYNEEVEEIDEESDSKGKGSN